MTSPLSKNFASQLSELAHYLEDNLLWPSPETGFALFVFRELSANLPTISPVHLVFPILTGSSTAPELAVAGFFAELQSLTANRVTPDGWSDAFSRLSERDPFPNDRMAFPFRPSELFGIALGVQHTPNLQEKQKSWLKEVLLRLPNFLSGDEWSKYLLSLCKMALGLADDILPPSQFPTLALDELALLVWLKAIPARRDKGFWKELQDKDLHLIFLRRCLEEELFPSDVGRAAILYSAIKISTNALLESEVAKNWQLHNSTRDAVELVVQICQQFHLCALQLQKPYRDRPTMQMLDEYDVQHLMHALLRLHFEDVRPEEYTPSYAGNSSRTDFLLKRERVFVETKMTRKNLGQKEVVVELIEDKERYQAHPDCDALVCFVYDPKSYCTNPAALEDDVSEEGHGFLVRVVVGPRGR